MTPPSPDEQDTALAALAGTVTEAKPGTDLERNLLRLRLIGEAKTKGVSWTVIGAAMGVSGKEAKRGMKRLAARTQHDLMVSKAPKAAPGRESGPVARGAESAAVRDSTRSFPGKPRPPVRARRQHHIRRRGR